jgi:hypothetical protein
MMACTEIIDKQRLYYQMYRVREIRKLQEEIDNISQMLGSPSGIKLSDMPRAQNPFDKIGNLISRKMEKEKKLEELVNIAQHEKVILENIINRISILPENPKGPMNSVLQDILRYRYIDDYPWKEIINLLCPDNDAFIDMTESNLRKLHKWNGQALLKFIKCQGYLATVT